MATLERQPPEWNDQAPMRVEASRRIRASADAVFAELADHERWPEWFDALRKVEVTGEASGVGARRRVYLPGLGGLDEEFTAWEPGRAFGFAVLTMPIPLFRTINELVTIADEPDGESVTVTYLQATEPARWAAPVVRLVGGRLRASLDDALAALAARVEQS